jgi:hypothetical protein
MMNASGWQHGARVCAIALAALLIPSTAIAQSAGAESLFRGGRRHLKAGDVAGACAQFEASEELEASVGTLLNLGECREKLGETASAWASFRAAAAMARRQPKDDARAAEAKKRADKLEPKLTYLEIEIDAGTRVDGLAISRSGEVVDPGAWNTEVPVDPGTYTIVATAPGYRDWSLDIKVNAKERHRVVVVPPLQEAPPPVVEEPARPTRGGLVVRAERPGRVTTTRKVSIGVATAGVAAIGGGIAFGLRARDLQAQADDRCPQRTCADPVALDTNERAQRAALRANLLYAGGGVAIAAARVMWWVGAPDEGVVVQPTVGGDSDVGLSLAGRF